MACEFSSNTLQTVAPNGSLIFSESPVPCSLGMVFHRDESGMFRLASSSTIRGGRVRSCCCRPLPSANYEVAFHANVQIPTGGTVEPISLALVVDGEVDPSSTMTITPAAVQEPGNVGADIIVAVPYICRCSSVSVRNMSAQAIEVTNSNIIFEFLGIGR